MTVTQLRPATYMFTSSDASRAAVNAMAAACGAASTDGARPIITHVLVVGCGDHIKFLSTNSYRANRVTITTFDPVEFPAVMVSAKELKSQLPKLTEFPKTGNARLVIEHQPGPRELDSGYLVLRWGDTQRLITATPSDVGSRTGQYPNVEDLIESTVNDKVITNEAVCWSPQFLGDIAKEAKLINKDRPVELRPGSTPMKPGLFTTFNDEGVGYESLLMPVRRP